MPNKDMSSVEKKRLRDRRSQKTLRDKKLQHTSKLEKQVAHCEQNHSDQGVQRLLQLITGLRKENETLRNRQERLKSFINSWGTESDTATADNASEDRPTPYKDSSDKNAQFSFQKSYNDLLPSTGLSKSVDKSSSYSSVTMSPQTQIRSPSVETFSPDVTPLWNQIPPHNDDFSNPHAIHSCIWFLYPEKITPCPDIPSSPLDILYGTKQNALADMIHTALQRRPARDPERLGIGWLVYHVTRWFLRPSPETYERLPTFLRPVQGQMEVEHPLALDFIPWPRLRLNMIRRWHIHCNNADDLFGMFSACIKIRWPWGEDILERDDENELCMKKRFYDTFMNQSGWGLTSDFIRKYPDLVEGMDMREVMFELI